MLYSLIWDPYSVTFTNLQIHECMVEQQDCKVDTHVQTNLPILSEHSSWQARVNI